jgi:hypothetical protein
MITDTMLSMIHIGSIDTFTTTLTVIVIGVAAFLFGMQMLLTITTTHELCADGLRLMAEAQREAEDAEAERERVFSAAHLRDLIQNNPRIREAVLRRLDAKRQQIEKFEYAAAGFCPLWDDPWEQAISEARVGIEYFRSATMREMAKLGIDAKLARRIIDAGESLTEEMFSSIVGPKARTILIGATS